MKKKQTLLLGNPGKMPKSQLKSLLLIVLLVLALPLLALAAKMAVDLNSRAFLPSGSLCKEALLKYNYEKPCKIVQPTTIPTRGTSRTIAKKPPTPTISRLKNYGIINFTCVDGYTERYEVKACTPEDKLLTYAYSVCNNHSLVKDVQMSEGCAVRPTPVRRSGGTQKDTTATQPLKGFKKVKFTCADGFITEYTTTCQTEESLRNYVLNSCRTHSICPTRPTVTPTKTPTPTISKTPTISLTPTASPSSNINPTITTNSLPLGYVGQTYSARIVATDPNLTDRLNITFSGLPGGIVQGPCAVPSSGGQIECYLSGKPTSKGNYTINVTASDNQGGLTGKSLNLYIY